MKSPLRVFIVDDHELVRAGLRSILSPFPDLKIVGEAADGASAEEAIPRARPQVVLLDLRLPDCSGIDLCRALLTWEEPPKILILTSFMDQEAALQAMEAGASGFLIKQIDREGLRQALLDAAAGHHVLPPVVAEEVARALRERAARSRVHQAWESLSEREAAIVRGVADGLQNKEIGARLGISEKTVRNSLVQIFTRLGVSRRAQLAAWAVQNPPP